MHTLTLTHTNHPLKEESVRETTPELVLTLPDIFYAWQHKTLGVCVCLLERERERERESIMLKSKGRK